MSGNTVFVFLSSMFFACLILIQPAYAHSFNDYESAAFLAKIPEVKIETNLIATHAGNKDAINYYDTLLKKYWTFNDTRELNERNPQLASLISSTINDTISDAKAGNADMAYSDYFSIAGYMEQAGVVRVDPIPLNNSTIQAMSIAIVLRESLERYGDAIKSSELGNLSSMTVSKMEYANGMTSTGTPKIANEYAYENSKELAQEALQMYGQLITHNDDKKTYNDKIGNFMTKYITDLNNMADPNTVISDVYMGVYPNFVSGYRLNLESIPEFPVPALMVAAIISVVIAITRFDLKKLV
ncbi:MAG: hypothetical protein ACREBI_10880 [Nitrosotalea sp.]